MSEAAQHSTGGGGQSSTAPLKKFIKLFLMISIVFIIWQLYLNSPVQRPKVICLPAYKTYSFFRVSFLRIFLPKDHDLVLDGIKSSESFYFSCQSWVSIVPGVGVSSDQPSVTTNAKAK